MLRAAMIQRTRPYGFSLIELMIALAAGLIVVGAVLSFTVATVRSSAETLGATRLTQDLRLAMNLMVRETRRAGYDRRAETSIASSTPGVRYTAVTVGTATAGNDCIVISYNRGTNATGAPLAGEWKGFRRIVRDGRGVLQANTQADPPECDEDDDWVDLTNPAQVDVTSLVFTHNQTAVAGLPGGITATVRDVEISLGARLSNDASVARVLTDRVRIRADDVVFPAP